MTRANMLSVLDASDIIEIMVPTNQQESVSSDVREFLGFNHGLDKAVLNAIIIFGIMKAEHFTGFNVYLRKVMESFKKGNATSAATALEYIKTNRDITRKNNPAVIEPDWMGRYIKEIEQMG